MSTIAATAAPRPGFALLRRIPIAPAEGWLTVVATATMAVVLGASFKDAAWAPGPVTDGDFLPWLGFGAFLLGLGGAKVGWGRWRTHTIGALLGGLLLVLITGGIALHHGAGWDPRALAERVVAAHAVAVGVWTDLVIRDLPRTVQSAHYHLVFGALVWASGLLAGFTVFGHRRPLDAVVVLGLVLLANMALTPHNQLVLLEAFSAAALLLLIRTHVFEEELVWVRRRIGDPKAVGQLYLRGGAVFVAAAVMGSILLTSTASSAPLQGFWQDLPRTLRSVTDFLQRFAPDGEFRGSGAFSFGRNALTLGRWDPSDDVAFRAQFRPTETRDFKWRAGAYADYTLFGWSWGNTTEDPTAARDVLLSNSSDLPVGGNRRQIFVQVRPAGFRDLTVLGPNTLGDVDQASKSFLIGDGQWYASVEMNNLPEVYNVTGLVPVFQDVQGGITEARLRVAGNDYDAISPELMTLYGPASLPVGALGPTARQLLDEIRAEVDVPEGFDPANAYDLARTMERYLRDDGGFVYDTNVEDEKRAQCNGISTVECFAIIKRGFCVYYASTMAVLLREAGVPARVAYGFQPSEHDASNLETVLGTQTHWWVEVYFPGTGWVEFDPTGGGVGQPLPIPSGSVGPPTAAPTRAAPTIRDDATGDPGGPITPPPEAGAGIGPFIAISLILFVGFAALAFAAYRRTPNRPMHPDQAWGAVARLAARLGLGPKPSQTVYEYAGALGDIVPEARVELTTIARAKVEVAYGRRDLGGDRLRRIAQAYHRLRLALLRVLVRRGLRRGRRSGERP